MLIETPALLITDDDEDFRETLREVFAPRGFRTLLAADGEEAIGILHREPVHLWLLDMHMPRLTGLQTIDRARELRATIPWILLSAALDDQIIEAARKAEAFSVLPKPVRFAEITRVVREALRAAYDWTPNE
ncbi:MAG TPA: response regulator [Pirellulaceae bacterium]|nr:response regulator [Pirellulaceae bacterium]